MRSKRVQESRQGASQSLQEAILGSTCTNLATLALTLAFWSRDVPRTLLFVDKLPPSKIEGDRVLQERDEHRKSQTQAGGNF